MKRRAAIKGLAAFTAAAGSLQTNQTFGMGRSSRSADNPFTATRIASAIRSKDISATEVAEDVITRVEAGVALGAFISFQPETLRAAARAADEAVRRGDQLGPLHGVPIALKDNIEAVGYPNTGGTPALKDYRPQRNATATQRLLDAGAVIAGKVNMDELAGGGMTNNPTFGRTRNPYNTDHIPGGSSGGSAAAVGGRLVPAALGTDTAGSIRTPAAYCGIAGLRPTQSALPIDGIVPLALSRDTCGPLATTVEDVALIHGALAQDARPIRPRPLRGVRLGLPETIFQENLSPAVSQRFSEVIDLLQQEGAIFVRQDIPNLVSLVDRLSLITLGGAYRWDMTQYLVARNTGVTFDELANQIADPFVRGWIEPFLEPTEELRKDYDDVIGTVVPYLRDTFHIYLRENELDGILFPTAPVTAGIQTSSNGDMLIEGETVPDGIWLNVQNTGPASLWGGPGLSIPAGLSDNGLPVGVEIDGPILGDRDILSLGLSIESVMPPTPSPA